MGQSVRFDHIVNSGYLRGAVESIRSALVRDLFKGYAWVVRLNPDVMIRRDDYIVTQMARTDIDGIFVKCGSNWASPKYAVHTDFAIFRPNILSASAFDDKSFKLNGNSAERTFGGAVSKAIETGRFAWMPQTSKELSEKAGECRVG